MEKIIKTPVKIKRVAAKVRPRKAVKLSDVKTKKTVYTEMFDSLAPPQIKYRQPKVNPNLDLTNISSDQLAALQEQNFALWALTTGLEVDNKPFDFHNHRYIIPMYLDDSKEIVLMKAAQMGATIWVLLRLLHFCLFNKVKACFYFPTQDGVSKLSRDRLSPLIRSNSLLSTSVLDTDTIGYKKIGEWSSLYLQHMGGEATKDSTPFDMICFDEVRLLNSADIDQARERLSHSTYKRVMQVSTAGMPGCFTGNTSIPILHSKTGKKISMTFEQLWEESSDQKDYHVLSYQFDPICKPTWKPINYIKFSGIKPIVRLHLSRKKTIECTEDHPFAVFDETNAIKWLPAKSLEGKKIIKLIKLTGSEEDKDDRYPWLTETKVKKVEFLNRKERVFDIEIGRKSHWFFLHDSRCLVHNSDIARAFNAGTQNYWHVKCSSKCSDGFIPSEHWPDCVGVTKDKEVYLMCPKCKTRITDPQDGRYIAHNPGAPYPSYHISQLISRYISIGEIWDFWQRTTNIKEFYNAKLGKPYVDEENQPIKEDTLAACENHDLMWGPSKTKLGGKIQRAMGIDQMSGINYAIIAERHSNKKRIIHYEIIDDRNPIYMEAEKRVTPFKRCYELMKEYDIDLCIIDAMPNINEAMEFARAFQRRVFVAHYIEAQRELVQWGDRPRDKINIRRGGPKIKFKYTCLLSRYLSLDYMFSEVINRNFEWPRPEQLVQVARSLESGLYEPLHIFRTHFYRHMKSMVRQKTMIDEDTGRFKMEWVYLGFDPHSAHCTNLCNIALERLRRQPIFTLV